MPQGAGPLYSCTQGDALLGLRLQYFGSDSRWPVQALTAARRDRRLELTYNMASLSDPMVVRRLTGTGTQSMLRNVLGTLNGLAVMAIAVCVIRAPVALAQQGTGKPALTVEALLGSWRLERFEAVRDDGRVFLPFGDSVSGTLVYLADGQMVVAYGRQDRPIPQQPNSPTPVELAKMVEGFDAYWGSFEVDVARGQVTHHVKGAFEPHVTGTDRVRSVLLSGDTLVLSVPRGPCWWELVGQCVAGEQIQLRLTWRRS